MLPFDAFLLPLPALARRQVSSVDLPHLDIPIMAFGVFKKHSGQVIQLSVL